MRWKPPAGARAVVAMLLATCSLALATAAAAAPDGLTDTIVTGANSVAAGAAAVDGDSGPSRSRSIGYPFRGRLEHGRCLEESEHLRFVASELAQGQNTCGTEELVGALERTGQRLAKRFGGARLAVGELSAPRGGRLRGHRSHQSGRDADVAFLLRDRGGRRVEPSEFVDIGRGGLAVQKPYAGLSFDTAANLFVVRELIEDPTIHLQFIFVSRGLAARMLAEATRRGMPRALRTRMERMMIQPRRHAHRNHFHVRIYCTDDDQPDCRDRGPFWQTYPFAPEWVQRS